MKQTFNGITIAIPESRQLDVLANLFIKRGATAVRCPLVSIHDTPNETDVKQWLNGFIHSTPEIFIILTGEGIKRLTAFAERFGIKDQWQQALLKTHLIARGPKPNRALKLLHVQADELAIAPTTDGVIASLKQKDLANQRLAIQLYGEDPNDKLQSFLLSQQVEYTTVAPYIYASDTEEGAVLRLIDQLAASEIDLICFTSKAQYSRLTRVATAHKMLEPLKEGMLNVKIAAVGPVVADQLKEAGFTVDVMPETQYFMKPMVRAIESLFLPSNSQ